MVRVGVGVTAVLLALVSAACGGTARPRAQAAPTTTTTTAAAPTTTTTTVPSLQWSAPQVVDTSPNGLGDVSCPTTTFCVAVGGTGPGVVGKGFIWNGTTWSPTAPQLFSQDSGGYNHVSCPTVSFCMAGSPDGGAIT